MDDAQLRAAITVAGLDFTPEEFALMREGVDQLRDLYVQLRAVPLGNDIAPALRFDPAPPGGSITARTSPHEPLRPPAASTPGQRSDDPADGQAASAPSADEPVRPPPVRTPGQLPDDPETVAFLPLARLGELLRQRAVTSTQLTTLFLDRLKRYGPRLECVVTLTEEQALRQARQADDEIAAGRYRGPLHGIPWGAKDLLATRGYPTTWGSAAYREQVIEQDATVVERLDAAGAVLVAKLTLGELAMGDVWFGGQTRNPWNLAEGSSGSSAGSAAATAAGLVGFAIGSETRGSIISPATRCGVTGLRPTFGRVSRHGAMALAWSMDKIGPICRRVEECALVFDAIRGPDGKDPTAVDRPFAWSPRASIAGVRIGVVARAFDERPDDAWKVNDRVALDRLRAMGAQLVPIELPDVPIEAMRFILEVEAAAAFDELTRSGRDDLLVRQVEQAWPNIFRRARLIPAVEYLQANRVRTVAMLAMERLLAEVDLFVAPTFGGGSLALTNLTGHPAVCVPNGWTEADSPTSITFTGRLYDEAGMLAVAYAYQQATGVQPRRPELIEGSAGA